MEGNRPNLGAVSKVAQPFYEPPARKTSADIINEARAAIRDKGHFTDTSFNSPSIKPLQTQRPFTPRDKERILFGCKAKSSRPPSSFSLRYLQAEADLAATSINSPADELINTGYGNKSAYKSKKKFFKNQRSNSVSSIEEGKIFTNAATSKIKLPALTALKPLQKKKLYKNTYSLDNLPEEYEESNEEINVGVRNAFSSPQERTDFNKSQANDSPFDRPSQRQNNLSKCFLLGGHNLNKLFDNKYIVENSETLFIETGYFNNLKRNFKLSDETQLPLDTGSKSKTYTVDNLLAELQEESTKNKNDIVVIHLLGILYDCLEKENSTSSKIDSKMKIQILKCLYKYVESQNEQLLLGIARIILALKVTGNNLSGVCKLIFKVAKCDGNDDLFMEKNILDLFVNSLGRASPLDDGEACVYGYGSIKFLTMNPKLLKQILDHGILQLMVLHIKIVNNAKLEKLQIPEQTNHALFQLTGAIRNLAGDESIYEEFISTGAVFQLCQAMDLFSSNLDIVSNISRTLSTISTNDMCCVKITEYQDIYKIFVKLFDKYPGNEEIMVRLAYTLGNILAKLDNSRIKFFQEKNSIESLVHLWKIYIERTLKNCSLRQDNENENGSNTEDVMIKIIRIVANMAINTDIGKAMNDKYGTQLIDEFLKALISNPFKKNNELVLSVLSTLNNLSYYYSAEFDKDIFHIKQIDITEAITEYLNSKNMECVIETIRILGNLSRSKITRNYIVESKIFNNLVQILDADDVNLLKTTVGVFVNLMSDNKNRILFKNTEGLTKLIHILNMHGQYDWPLSMLTCQVIWNLSIESPNLNDIISDNEMQQLLAVLADYLGEYLPGTFLLADEERLFGITDPCEDLEVYSTPEYIIWEEFANVATNLLEKIEHFLDTVDQIDDCSNIEDFSRIPQTRDSSTGITFAAW